jgi:ribonuclease P protein component
MEVKTIRQKSVFEALKKDGVLYFTPNFKIRSLPQFSHKKFLCGISIARQLGSEPERVKFRRVLKAAIGEVLSVYPELGWGVYEIIPNSLDVEYDKICYELELFLTEHLGSKGMV